MNVGPVIADEGWKSLLRQRAAGTDMGRLPGWHASVGIVLDGAPFVITHNVSQRLDVADWRDDADRPATTVEVTGAAMRQWLLQGVDFTHLVKSGGMAVTDGTYFDVLLLSKALRLRPESAVGGAA